MVRALAAPGRIATASLLALAAACGGGTLDSPGNHGPYPFTNVPAPAGGVAQFSVLPTTIAPGLTLTTLGNLAPPGHVLPTDHVYLYDWDLADGRNTATDTRDVLVPATGAVFQVIQPTPSDYKIMFRATSTFYFYLDHVLLTRPIAVGDILPAGTKIGTTAPGSTLDLGAFDESVTHTGFVTPARYPEQTRYYVSPWRYFTPELQQQVAAHLYRAPGATDRDGRIDFGVAGRLVGDWFLRGMPIDSSSGPYGWTRSISFAYDYYDPSQVRISIGGTVAPPGVWAIDSTVPPPSSVSVATGIVRYRLYSPFDNHPPYGLMLVQMLDDATIQVEVFVGANVTTAQFDANAVTFVR